MVKPLSKEKREEIEEFLTKGERIKHAGYIHLRLGKAGQRRNIKRSRAYYQYFNRIELNPLEIIHHRDENKLNDDIRNLELMKTEDHATNHHAGIRHRHHKPRIKSNKLKEEIINEIIKLSNNKDYRYKNGRINYSKIGRALRISDFTVSRYIKDNQKNLVHSVHS